MRVAIVCLLSLFVIAAADAAPAPMPKGRNPFPSTEQVKEHLRDHHQMQVQSIKAQGKREWIAVGYLPLPYRYEYRSSPPPIHVRSRGVVQRVYVVKYQGKDDQGRPQFTLVDLETARLARP